MKTILVAMILSGTVAAAQPGSVIPVNIRAANVIDRLSDGNGLTNSETLYGIPLEPGRVVGSTYLNEEWKRTTVMMYNVQKMIEGYATRYEIDLNQVEIRTDAGVKVLSGDRVRSFVWVDSLVGTPHYFVNTKDYKVEKDGVKGFFEVLVEGPMTLLVHPYIVVRQPTYDERLDIGERDTRILKKTAFFYMKDDAVRELPSAKRKFLPVFGEHADAVEQFIRTNRLLLNEPNHLKIIFEHYNSRIIAN